MKKNKYHCIYKKLCFLVIGLLNFQVIISQDLENIGSRTLDKIKKTSLKINGAVSANSIFYNANGRSSREPFTYFLQGNLNIGWLTFNMPISYSFSNQGSKFDHQTPFKFNRLGLHPKYKWIQAHIGDVAMDFSPYTLSGHQFTGGGIELKPKGSFSISAMYGRLLKATEDDGEEKTQPAFKRIGYGSKIDWEKENYKLGLVGFYAKDDIKSISVVPDERNIKPKENFVLSVESEVKITDEYTIKATYASSAVTQDLRAVKTKNGKGLASLFFNNRSSTEFYDAFKINLDMQLDKMKVGIGYELIDPGYETLGAYFFNNDFENITLNASRPFFNDRLNLSFNVGYQRDNLNNQKTQGTNRIVGAVNGTFQITDKITLTGGYSNFSTHTNKSLNQFDDINDSDLTDEDLEVLDFKQLSQNANINLNWILEEREKLTQNINLDYSLAASANKQNGVIRIGQANTFHNGNAIYTIGFPKNNVILSSSLNYNYSDVGLDDSSAYGGALDVSKGFFEKKLNTTFGVTYNNNINKTIQTRVINLRLNSSLLVAEKHNFGLSAIQLFRNTTNQNRLAEITVTFNYAYAFDLNKPNFKFRKKNKIPKIFNFTYKKHTFSGEHSIITKQVTNLVNSHYFKGLEDVKGLKSNLSLLEKDIQNNEKLSHKKYKHSVFNYLDHLYKHKGFMEIYYKEVFESLKDLYQQASLLDEQIKSDYERLLVLVNSEKRKNNKLNKSDLHDLEVRKSRMLGHKFMKSELEKLTYEKVKNNEGLLKEFKSKYVSIIFKMIEAKKSSTEIKAFLSLSFAKFYHDKALKLKQD